MHQCIPKNILQEVISDLVATKKEENSMHLHIIARR